jgi:membrane-associated phospholipid phosphatase
VNPPVDRHSPAARHLPTASGSPIHWRSPATWAVPAAAVVIAVLLAVTGGNRAAFAAINAWSLVTGPAPWPYVTVLGDTAVALALFTPFVLRRPDIVWALAPSALLATAFVHGIKPFAELPRPPSVLAADALTVIGPAYKAHSFPSGHTTTIFVGAALLWLHFRSPWIRAVALVTATLVGLSRAVVGVHWPMDIAAGAAGGWCCALLGTALARRCPVGLGAPVQALLAVVGAACAVALLAGLKTGYPQAVQLQYAVGAGALGALALAVVQRTSANLR